MILSAHFKFKNKRIAYFFQANKELPFLNKIDTKNQLSVKPLSHFVTAPLQGSPWEPSNIFI